MAEPGPSVAVVGGGIIGCAVALELVRRGARVTVVERGRPGREAAWAAGGMLSPLSEAERPGPFLTLGVASLERFPEFVEAVQDASGVDVEYRTRGKLEVALDEAGATRLNEQYDWQRDEGFRVERLVGQAARAKEPALSPEVVAALVIADDHQVDNRRLGRALWIAAANAGARFRLGVPVARVAIEGGANGAARRVRGVELADGELLRSDHVVIAAGCWSGMVGGLPRPLPIFPVRGQMLALDTVPPAISRVIVGPGCYVIPRASGRLIVGSTMERVGFRAHATAGGVHRLLAAALRLLPRLEGARMADFWAGLRPGTPDELPILGRDPEIDGLIYATGHYRNGVLLAPITAELTAALVTGERLAVPVDAFRVDREFEPA